MTTANTTSRFRTAREALEALTRHVADFPEPGVIFQDLTPVFADGDGFELVIDELAATAAEMGSEIIAGLDARGFLIGSAVAYKLGQGVLAIRKRGKLPPPVFTEEYSLEYGTAALEIPAAGIPLAGKRVVVVDDVLATGGTLAAAQSLIESVGGTVVGHAVILEVDGLGGRDKLKDTPLVVLSKDGK